jgi:hypothetical protein
MASWRSLMLCTPARPIVSVRDHADSLEVSQGLLDCAEAVSIDERVNPSSGRGAPVRSSTASTAPRAPGIRPPKGLAKVHMNRAVII